MDKLSYVQLTINNSLLYTLQLEVKAVLYVCCTPVAVYRPLVLSCRHCGLKWGSSNVN